MTVSNYPLFVKRDLDGFFGLFIDNLVQLLLIVSLCDLCGITADSDLLLQAILPGAALSIFIGNIYYAWQAHRCARRDNRSDVTALPYGINTPSLLVYIFFVMVPTYNKTNDPRLAWQMGLVACLGSGVIELAGSFVAERIRRSTPRAALLSTLAGIAIGFISMTFALQIFHRPLIAMVPLAIVLMTYFARTSFPLGLPGGFLAVAMGTMIAWLLTAVESVWPGAPGWLTASAMDPASVVPSWQGVEWHLPQFAGAALWEVLSQPEDWFGFLSVIIPMGLFNIVGSLQNIESAEASGDRFDTASSLAANGVGTIVAALFGSCFPTTIYIGHPGWKQLGARAGYSTLNGVVIAAVCLTGAVGLINTIVPIEAGIAIVLWIGIVITAQAFQTTPRDHAPAVAMGLFPAIAAWGETVTRGAVIDVGIVTAGAATMQDLLTSNIETGANGFLIHGMLVLERGYIFTCMILAAISALLIDRKFRTAAIWSAIGALFAAVGLTHAYQLKRNNVDFLFLLAEPAEGALAYRGTGIAIGYLLIAIVFAAFAPKTPPAGLGGLEK
jgi:AGZA family xanthine/uracil permease-like MFS transporter